MLLKRFSTSSWWAMRAPIAARAFFSLLVLSMRMPQLGLLVLHSVTFLDVLDTPLLVLDVYFLVFDSALDLLDVAVECGSAE